MNGCVILLSGSQNTYLNCYYILGGYNYEIVDNVQYATIFKNEKAAIDALRQFEDLLTNYPEYSVVQITCESEAFRGFNSNHVRNIFMIAQKNEDGNILWYQPQSNGFQDNRQYGRKYSDPSYAKVVAYRLSKKYANVIIVCVNET